MQKFFVLPRIGPAFFPLFLCACGAQTEPPGAAVSLAPKTSACTAGAFFRGRILGGVNADLDWGDTVLTCTGGPRPDGEGARLRFAREDDVGTGLAIIVALPGLSRRTTGRELAANVTVIVEGEARFFSTQAREICWADVLGNELVNDDRYTVSGEVYCIAPLGEVNGTDSVTLDGVSFRGLVDWNSK